MIRRVGERLDSIEHGERELRNRGILRVGARMDSTKSNRVKEAGGNSYL